MAIQVFNFTDGVSGYVQLTSPSTYVAATGYANVRIAKQNVDRPAVIRHGFTQFPTGGSIPIGSVVTLVEYLWRAALVQASPMSDQCYPWIGSWVGSTLDASSADYSGGHDTMCQLFYAGSENTWIDLSLDHDVTSYVAVGSGNTTDIKLVDGSYLDNGTSFNFNTSKFKCQLRVTWTPPITGVKRGLRVFR